MPRDIRIHHVNGEVQDYDKANIIWQTQAAFSVTGSPNNIDDDVVTDHKDLILRECVCRIEPGPDAFDDKEIVLIFAYWRLDEDGNRIGDVPIRFALHIAWSDAAIYYEDILVKYTGGASNKNPNLSLGGTLSSFLVAEGPVDTAKGIGLFDDITYDEHKPSGEGGSGDVEYRVIRIENLKGPGSPVNLEVWIENPDDVDPDKGEDSFGYEIALAADMTPFVAAAANENTDPNPENSYVEQTQNTRLAVGSVGQGTAGMGLVLRRTVTVDP